MLFKSFKPTQLLLYVVVVCCMYVVVGEESLLYLRVWIDLPTQLQAQQREEQR